MCAPTIYTTFIIFSTLFYACLVSISIACIPTTGQVRCSYCHRPPSRIAPSALPPQYIIQCDCSTYSGTPRTCSSECFNKEMPLSYGQSYEPTSPPPVVTALMQGSSRQIDSKYSHQIDQHLQQKQQQYETNNNKPIIKVKTSMIKHPVPQPPSTTPEITPSTTPEITPSTTPEITSIMRLISSTLVYPPIIQKLVKMENNKANYDIEVPEMTTETFVATSPKYITWSFPPINNPPTTPRSRTTMQSGAYGIEDSNYPTDPYSTAEVDQKVEPAQVYRAAQSSVELSGDNGDKMDKIEFTTNGQMYRRYFHKMCRGIQLGSSVEQSTRKAIQNCEQMAGCSALNLRTLNSALKVEVVYMKDIHSTMRTQSGYDCLEIVNK